MSLRLDDQLCFPIYAASRRIQAVYRPLLDPLGLTYPQYLVMLVLWEGDDVSVSHIGERLALDSGTLTPLLKRLEAAGRVRRARDADDNRVVRVVLTDAGRALRDEAEGVPRSLLACVAPAAGEVDALALKQALDALNRGLAEVLG
jgi:DNA-binding MarR family transcriptional regulator